MPFSAARFALATAPALALASVDAAPLKASFIVVGDWGFDPKTNWGGLGDGGRLQKNIANRMFRTYREESVRFVINVGDSFYPNGIQSWNDSDWKDRFRDVYGDELTSIPWLSVYGNHDYEGKDGCAKQSEDGDLNQCAQVNVPRESAGGWTMPKAVWSTEDLSQNAAYKETLKMLDKDLNLEVVAMDLNARTEGGPMGICKLSWPSNGKACSDLLYRRQEESIQLLQRKHAEAVARGRAGILIFSHYPTDYFNNEPRLMTVLRNETIPLAYFGGHRHSVYINSWGQNIGGNQKNNWLVGGGGGWACDGSGMSSGQQGFVLGTLGEGLIVTKQVTVEESGKGTCLRKAVAIEGLKKDVKSEQDAPKETASAENIMI